MSNKKGTTICCYNLVMVLVEECNVAIILFFNLSCCSLIKVSPYTLTYLGLVANFWVWKHMFESIWITISRWKRLICFNNMQSLKDLCTNCLIVEVQKTVHSWFGKMQFLIWIQCKIYLLGHVFHSSGMFNCLLSLTVLSCCFTFLVPFWGVESLSLQALQHDLNRSLLWHDNHDLLVFHDVWYLVLLPLILRLHRLHVYFAMTTMIFLFPMTSGIWCFYHSL